MSEMCDAVKPRVAITAMGCVSPLGAGIAEMREAIRTGRDCVTAIERFEVSGCGGHSAGQVRDQWLDRPCRDRDTPTERNRAARMLLRAMDEAVAQRPGFHPDIAVIGTTSGGMELGERFFRAAVAGVSSPYAARWVRSYVPQAPVLDAMHTLGWNAPCRILSNACASGTNALGHALGLVRSGRAKRVLAGGYDVLCQLVFAGFDALKAYTPEVCRPFDSQRSGLVLGEGAAVFFVERVDTSDAEPLAELSGYGSSSDNHHLTQPNPDGSGPRLAMERALRDAGRRPDAVDYINAHGTATPFNDACEAAAVMAICPDARISSTKGQMGHSLGAAGAIEAAVCIAAMQDGIFPANIHFRGPDAGVRLRILENPGESGSLQRVLSNSLGFGGANASIVLERIG